MHIDRIVLIVLLVFLNTISKSQTPVWAFNIGGVGADVGQSCFIAPNGNVMLTGGFSGTIDLDPGPGVYNITSNGLTDIFLACYSPAGGFLWGFGIGGINYDGGWYVTTDGSSNVIVCGFINSAGIDFDPGSGVSIIPFAGGGSLSFEGDGFVAKYSPTGVFQWAKDLGGATPYDKTFAIAVDGDDNIYVGGVFSTSMAVAGGPIFLSTVAGTAYIIKYTPSGSVVWGHNFGQVGGATADCAVLSLKSSGTSIYACGYFRGLSNFNPWGTPATLFAGATLDYDGYVAKYDTAGTFQFVKQIHGSGNVDVMYQLQIDPSENIYVTGLGNGNSVVFDAGATSPAVPAPGGGFNQDILMAKYSSTGSLLWGHVLGGPANDGGYGIEVIGSELFTTGQFGGTVDFDPSTSVASMASSGLLDMYLTKYDLDGNYLCSSRVGTASLDDIGNGLTHDAAGRLYNCGQFGGISTDFDPSSATLSLSSNGSTDIYLAKYNPECGFVLPPVCNSVSLPDTIHLCIGDTTIMPTVLTGTNPVESILWTPATGLSDPTILNPLLTATTSGMYHVTVASLLPGNLVTNGDFSAGFTGFTSGYVTEVPATTSPGHYDILTNPSTYTSFPSFGDHTTGTGNMMLVDGSMAPGISFWCNTVTVLPATDYHFSVWSALAFAPAPSLQLSINGSPIGTFTTTSIQGEWVQYEVTWNSGAATTANICMEDLNTDGFGNDFAIDDISFQKVCTATDSVYFAVAPLTPDIHVHDTTVCSTAFPVVLSAYTTSTGFTWSTGSTSSTTTVTDTGTYWVVSSSTGCSYRVDTIHLHSVVPTQDIHIHDTTICTAALPATLTGPAGFAGYTWSTGSTASSIGISAAGTYWVRTSVVSCNQRIDTFHVTLSTPVPDIHVHDTSACSTLAPVTLTGPAGFPGYTWNTGSTSSTLGAAASGTYWVRTSVVSCALRIDTFHVTLTAPIPDIHIHDTAACAALVPIVLTAPAGFTGYTWNTGATSTTLSAGVGGTYWVSTPVVSCAFRLDTFHVVIHPMPVVALGNDTGFCTGNTLVLSSPQPAGSSYIWSTGATSSSIGVSSTGSYMLTVINSFGCTASDIINVSVAPPPVVNLGPDTTVCIGTPLTLHSSGTYTSPTYLWNDLSTGATKIASATGTYWLQITQVGCASADTIHIDIIYDSFTLHTPDTAICLGRFVQVLAEGAPGSTYHWFPTAGMPVSNISSPMITPDTSAMYVVKVSYPGCPDIRDSFFLDVQPIPDVFVSNYRHVCRYDTLRIKPSVKPSWYTGYHYSWSPATNLDDAFAPNVVFTAGDTTRLILAVTTSAGCKGVDSTMIYTHPINFASVRGDTVICPRDTVRLWATGGASYKWTPSLYLDNTSSAAPLASAVTSQTYTVLATSAFGCKDTLSTHLYVHPGAAITMLDSAVIEPGQSVHIITKGNCSSFLWSPSGGLDNRYSSNPVSTPEVSTRYIVRGTTEWGCVTVDTIEIIIDANVVVAVPNAFAPANGKLYVLKKGLVNLRHFRIYNRWGNVVFETTDITHGWDGTYKGTPQPLGVFVYTIEAETGNGDIITKSGNVTLLR